MHGRPVQCPADGRSSFRSGVPSTGGSGEKSTGGAVEGDGSGLGYLYKSQVEKASHEPSFAVHPDGGPGNPHFLSIIMTLARCGNHGATAK